MILTILSLLIHEYVMSFHLFTLYFISFNNDFQFLVYVLYFFVNFFLSNYFDAILNGIDFSNPTDFSFLACRLQFISVYEYYIMQI